MSKIPEVHASRAEYREAVAAHEAAQSAADTARKQLEAAELALAAAAIRLARAIGSGPDKQVFYSDGSRKSHGRVIAVKGSRLVIERSDSEATAEVDSVAVVPAFAHSFRIVAGR